MDKLINIIKNNIFGKSLAIVAPNQHSFDTAILLYQLSLIFNRYFTEIIIYSPVPDILDTFPHLQCTVVKPWNDFWIKAAATDIYLAVGDDKERDNAFNEFHIKAIHISKNNEADFQLGCCNINRMTETDGLPFYRNKNFRPTIPAILSGKKYTIIFGRNLKTKQGWRAVVQFIKKIVVYYSNRYKEYYLLAPNYVITRIKRDIKLIKFIDYYYNGGMKLHSIEQYIVDTKLSLNYSKLLGVAVHSVSNIFLTDLYLSVAVLSEKKYKKIWIGSRRAKIQQKDCDFRRTLKALGDA